MTIELRSVNHRSWTPVSSFRGPGWRSSRTCWADSCAAGPRTCRVCSPSAPRRAVGSRGSHRQRIGSEYLWAAGELAEELRVDGSLGVRELLAMSGVLTSRERPIDASTEAPQVISAMEQALDALLIMRRAEGQRLGADLLERIKVAETTE